MLHIDLLNEEGKQRHHTLLHEAEQWRQQQRTRAHQTRLWDRLRIYIGSRFTTGGLQLKTDTQPTPQLD
jgi:hypothetical protein